MFTSSWNWKLGLVSSVVIGGAIACLGDSAIAQIIPDTTLGKNSQVTSTGSVEQIDGGATRGANLFHSFQEFNINQGRSALFTNPPGIENILSRVTGRNPSNILGTLGVSGGNANLFLINPNGIIFGPNAQLKVGGSFVGTTANAIGLANGEIFSANPVQPLPSGLLNVNPNAFFFNQIAAKAIINRSTAVDKGLEVQPGRSLLLVGGDVRLEGGRLQAPGGRVELGGLEGSGTVGLNVNGSDLRLNFPEAVQRANVFLTDSANVDVSALRGGSIAINAQNLELAGESRLLGGMNSSSGSINSQAGNIEINATGAINLNSESLIENAVQKGAVGNAGNINITTGSLSATSGARLSATTYGRRGNAGNVNILARDTISFDEGGVFNRLERGVGKGGDINITTGSLSLTNGAKLIATTYGRGNAGNVTVNARERVSVDGADPRDSDFVSGIYSRVRDNAVGKGGNINIRTGSLYVTNGAELNTSTNARGGAGNIIINARDTVSFDGVSPTGRIPGAFSRVESAKKTVGGVGNAGEINITTGSLYVKNGAVLSTTTSAQGDAGNVTINAQERVSVDGVSRGGRPSGVFSRTEDRTEGSAEGKGGSITITTGALSVK